MAKKLTNIERFVDLLQTATPEEKEVFRAMLKPPKVRKPAKAEA